MGNTCCCASLRDKIEGEYKTLAKKQKEQQDLLEKHKKQQGIAQSTPSNSNDGHLAEDEPIDLVPKTMPKELRKKRRRNSSDCEEEEKEDLCCNDYDYDNDLNCSANDQTMSTVHN